MVDSSCVTECDNETIRSSVPSIEPKLNNVFSISPKIFCDEIDVFDIEQYNVLFLGESGAGKTTFRKVLRNIDCLKKTKNMHGTLKSTFKNTLFSINKQFVSVNILDTPGFMSASFDSERINDIMRSVVTECVSRDTMRIDLILIVINGSRLMTVNQLANISLVMNLLGQKSAARTCLLVTHFESRDIDDEKKWIADFTSNPNMRNIMAKCHGGILFTGALEKNQFDNQSLCDSYIIKQCRWNDAFFDKLRGGGSVSIY